MKTSKLGNTEIQIPPIAFGGNVLGWTADEKMSFKLLDELLEKGFNYIDSANAYSNWVPGHHGGESETVLGKWMASRNNRDKVIIGTKVGMLVDHNGLSAANIKKQIDASLKRLQTDYVDVYFSHKYDEDCPQLETLETFDSLVTSGKVRTVGASNYPLEKLKEAQHLASENGLARFEVYQPEYNLMRREKFEEGYQSYCLDQNISVTSYFTLASGFLTGKYDKKEDIEGSSREKQLEGYFTENGTKVLKALKEISEKHDVSQAGAAMAWTMAQPAITAPIASATKPEHLKSFYEALKTNLDKEDMHRLDVASGVESKQTMTS